MKKILQGILTSTIVMFTAACDDELKPDNFSGQLTETVTAKPVNDFLNSIGINTAIYTRGETLDKTIECVKYCGFRWVRAGYEGTAFFNNGVFQKLHDETGVLFSYGMGSGGTDTARVMADARKLHEMGAFLAFESLNEPNNWGIIWDGEAGGGENSWLPVAKFQRDFYARVKSDPVMSQYPMFGISTIGAENDNVGLQYLTIPEGAGTLMPDGTQYYDYGNCHNYAFGGDNDVLRDNQTWLASSPGNDNPFDGPYGNFVKTWAKGFLGYDEETVVNMPRVSTETGVTIHTGVDEDMQGRMFLNIYLSQFKRGWAYTSIYILRDRIDEGGSQTYGFYAPGYVARKAAHYIHNFTTILADDRDKSTTAGTLTYSIPKKPETVHHLLLQKTTGKYYLIIWGERYTGGTNNISISFDQNMSSVKVYDPTIGTEAISTHNNTGSISLEMGVDIAILEIEK